MSIYKSHPHSVSGRKIKGVRSLWHVKILCIPLEITVCDSGHNVGVNLKMSNKNKKHRMWAEIAFVQSNVQTSLTDYSFCASTDT